MPTTQAQIDANRRWREKNKEKLFWQRRRYAEKHPEKIELRAMKQYVRKLLKNQELLKRFEKKAERIARIKRLIAEYNTVLKSHSLTSDGKQ